ETGRLDMGRETRVRSRAGEAHAAVRGTVEEMEVPPLEPDERWVRDNVARQLLEWQRAERARARRDGPAISRPPSRQVEHPLAQDVLDAEIAGREMRAHGDRHGSGEVRLARVDREVVEEQGAAVRELAVADRAIAQPEREQLQRGRDPLR